jgi:hypothetical protein
LRAERESLIASGQVAYWSRNGQKPLVSSANNHPQSSQISVKHRSTNGDVVNYAAPNNGGNSQVVVAPNSQNTDLPFLEQMTPTERQHYYRDLALRNRGYQVDVYHHHDDSPHY